MSVNFKTATAVIALMVGAGAYPVATMAQSQTEAAGAEAIETQAGAQTTGEAAAESASEAGQAIGQAAEATGDAVTQGAEAVGDKVMQGVSEAAEAVDQATGTTAESTTEGTAEATGSTATEGTAEATGSTATEGTAEATGTATVIEEGAAETATGALEPEQVQELEQAAAEGKPVPPVEMIMGVQGDSQWLSSELIDEEVRNPAGEVIGDIGAILFSEQGPDAVIVEVGGFLGMGEKEVAIKWSELAISPEGIVVAATEEQLKNAPEFVSLEEQRMDAEVQQGAVTTGTQGSLTTGTQGAMTTGTQGSLTTGTQGVATGSGTGAIEAPVEPESATEGEGAGEIVKTQ